MMLPDTFLIGRCAVMGFVSIFRYFEIRTFSIHFALDRAKIS